MRKIMKILSRLTAILVLTGAAVFQGPVLALADQQTTVQFKLETLVGQQSVELGLKEKVWLSLSDTPLDKSEDTEATETKPDENGRITIDLPAGISYEYSQEEQINGEIHYVKESNQLSFNFSDPQNRQATFQIAANDLSFGNLELQAKQLKNGQEMHSNILKVTIGPARTSDSASNVESVTDLPIAKAAETVDQEVDVDEYEASTIANVDNWADFIQALAAPEIAAINVTNSFAVPVDFTAGVGDVTRSSGRNTSGTASYLYMNTDSIARDVVIEGNGHTIDFGAICLCFDNRTAENTDGWHISWQNFEIFHGNYYGFTTYNNLNRENQEQSSLTLHNITDVGSQLMHSPYARVFISGKTSSIQSATFTSEFRTDWAINTLAESNLHISDLTVMENAEFTLQTINSGNAQLVNGGSLTLEKNSTTNITALGTSTGEAAGTNLLIQDGNLVVEEGATLNLTPKAQYSALSINSAGSTVEIKENAGVFIRSKGHTSNSNAYNRSIVYMRSGASLDVASGGILDIEATEMESSSSNVIHVAGNASFTVKKNGIFNVISDSTSRTHSLLNFTSAGSTFQFKDAQRVNLQRKGEISGADTNGLINITGSSGTLDMDIQKVSMWERGDFAETPSKSWQPMYDMVLTYRTYTPTVTSAYSLTQENIDSFTNEFTTRNVQRVLFEYIPDVQVEILSNANDETDSKSSTEVSGTTNPGAYVRISDTPINETIDPAIDPENNRIPSPVTANGSVQEFTDNFTVQADKSGNFIFTVPEGQHFKAGSVIQAYAFLNGKYDTATQVTKDVTPPSGKGKIYHAAKNERVPDPRFFVQNESDSNPKPQNFSYQYTTDTADLIAEWLTQTGEYDIGVLLKDEAGNSTLIESELVVHDLANLIEATGFTVPLSEIENLDEADLNALILERCGALAAVIKDGLYTDLTADIQITLLEDFIPEVGEHEATLTVGTDVSGLAEELTISILFTILNNGPTEPVDPENPVLESTPPNGAENGGTGNTGSLRLDYVPSRFSFGTVKASLKDQTYSAQKAENLENQSLMKQWVQVSDDRLQENGWSLSVQQVGDFQADPASILPGAFLTLPAGKIYNTRSGSVPVTSTAIQTDQIEISKTSQTVLLAKNQQDAGKAISTKVWDSEAVTLKVNGGTAVPDKRYTTTINWTLTSNPNN